MQSQFHRKHEQLLSPIERIKLFFFVLFCAFVRCLFYCHWCALCVADVNVNYERNANEAKHVNAESHIFCLGFFTRTAVHSKWYVSYNDYILAYFGVGYILLS